VKNPLAELINPTPKPIDSMRHYEILISCKETKMRHKVDVEMSIRDATTTDSLHGRLYDGFLKLLKVIK